jgi:tRNA G10  N-methylase Trm11
MISVRLARILINLSGVKSEQRILDPFCGLGTILQEAMFMGLDVYGIELDKKRYGQIIENLQWFKKEYDIKNEFKIKLGSAKRVKYFFKKNSVSAIVTEPYMGPFMKKMPGKKKAVSIVKKLEDIYEGMLYSAKDVLKKGSRIVMVVPRFQTKEGVVKVGIKEIIKKTGYRLYKKPILYKEKWHVIERLIYVFKK